MYRTLCDAILLFYAHQNVPSANVVKIIGKGANGLIVFRWIPSFLKLDPIALYFLFVEQIFYIDW